MALATLKSLLKERILVLDGAMGTMLQDAAPSLDDFEGLEGCNEILNITRPDLVRSVHDAYLAVGVDAIDKSRHRSPRKMGYGR